MARAPSAKTTDCLKFGQVYFFLESCPLLRIFEVRDGRWQHAPELHHLCWLTVLFSHCCSLSSSQRASQGTRESGKGVTSSSTMTSGKGLRPGKATPSCRWNMPGSPGLAPACLKEALGAVPSFQGGFHDPKHDGRLAVEGYRLSVCENFYFQENPGGSQAG